MTEEAETQSEWLPPPAEVAEVELSVAEKCQAFFADLATELRKPHYGDAAKGWTHALLHRAESAGIYKPENS